ncbi:MAG: O-acetyl-ADP-ribose deacetylase [Clostridia bacterium]|nr:O-acetyl-ADP-ribose deacetylase [Clostridia bacterium]
MPLLFERNDITRVHADAIVNAANESLLGGGGVDGAIHAAAGPELLEECRRLGGCETGQAKITGGYRLPCRYVIHTVGPVWRGGRNGERELLTACYRNSLALARSVGCETVAFPLISAGVYGYPRDEAVRVAVSAITEFLKTEDMTVTLVFYSGSDLRPLQPLYGRIKTYIDDIYDHGVSCEAAEEAADDSPADMSSLEDGMYERRTLARNAPAQAGAPRRRKRDQFAGTHRAFPGLHGAYQDIRPASEPPDLEAMLGEMDPGFSEALLRLIDERGMSDAECYHRANIDRRLFSKIRSNPDYRPSRQTAMAFCVALRLTFSEAQALPKRAGYAFSRSSRSDIVVEYCLRTGQYDINAINQVLFALDLPLLGS